ncbi:MAG: Gfo/Idh/MocA family oxidoreductase [Sphingomonadales bacterium]|nr:Gfo/Idh/MocA family oxidoreductase [Sphingomonadales bacterium]
MANGKLGVGIIGVQPERSWAAVAHIPALQALPGFEVTALSTTRIESARAAGEAYGVAHCYDNHRDLVNDPDVDVVAVTVKVPHHRELVFAALDAGKHVYCEWPLGNGLDDARAIAERARGSQARCVIGLQARFSPEILHVQKLIADGYVGRVLSTTLLASGLVWGPMIDTANAYTMDRSNGATMLSIPMGHSLDAVAACLGELNEVSAQMDVLQSDFLNVETGEHGIKTSPDQVAFTGTLASGATMACHYRAGACRGTNLLWEINGTEGDIQVTGMGGHMQMLDLTVSGGRGDAQALAPLPTPAELRTVPVGLAGPALNVAQVWQAFADDLATGSRKTFDFDQAVQRHTLLAAIERSAAHGNKEKVQ